MDRNYLEIIKINLFMKNYKNKPKIILQPTESEGKAVKKIDDLLDSFLGIRDMELCK